MSKFDDFIYYQNAYRQQLTQFYGESCQRIGGISK